jgi:rhodanese-related sulfurtransferase
MDGKNKKTRSTTRKNTRHKKSLPKWVLIFGSLTLLGVVLLIIFKVSNNSTPTLSQEISVTDAFELYQTGVLFVDVREKDEWEQIHIPNTTHIPLGELARRQKELPKDQQIVVVCRSGNRSQAGRDTLLSSGFTNVASMAGGVKDWSVAGYPTVTGE